jgi:rare lipoprotein A
MSIRFSQSISLAAAGTILLGGCLGTRQAPPAAAPSPPSVVVPSPPLPQAVPDAVPRYEPRSLRGNPPFYEVFGKRYFVLSSSADYLERGVASWYGPGFHKVSTSTGEPYDMYGMTAAHKTLPLPCYARVTNLQNGRSVVVRINDRGPFVGNRIIDLSYTAAGKLDMLRNGTAMVEVRTVMPATSPAVKPAVAPAPVSAPVSALYVQAGAFASAANAERLAQRLRDGHYGKVLVRDDMIAGRRMYRVRIGPVPDVPEFDRIVVALEQVGVRDAHLALD